MARNPSAEGNLDTESFPHSRCSRGGGGMLLGESLGSCPQMLFYCCLAPEERKEGSLDLSQPGHSLTVTCGPHSLASLTMIGMDQRLP